MNAWDEIVRNDVNEVLHGAGAAVNDTAATRPWPPIMIRDFIHAYDLSTREVDAGVSDR